MKSIFCPNPMLQKVHRKATQNMLVERTMTLQGTLHKVALSLLFVVFGAFMIWYKFRSLLMLAYSPSAEYVQSKENLCSFLYASMTISSLTAFVLSMITSFKRNWAVYLLFPYAFVKGMALAAFSMFAEITYTVPGITLQAVLATNIVLFTLFILYSTGMIYVNSAWRATVRLAVVSLGILVILTVILSLFGLKMLGSNILFSFDSSPLSIIISIALVLLVSVALIADVSAITEASEQNVYHKREEWYCAFALLVTIFWLYIEILRLLIKIAGGKRRR